MIAYRHGGGGIASQLFDFIAHAAIWAAVGRIVRVLPGGPVTMVAVVVVVGLVLVVARRRGGRRRSARS